MRVQLNLTQEQLSWYIGVSLVTIKRWERADGTFPRRHRWMRIREVWRLVRILKDPEFLKDRAEPPDFKN